MFEFNDALSRLAFCAHLGTYTHQSMMTSVAFFVPLRVEKIETINLDMLVYYVITETGR
jgi:hypothetical protein